MVFLSENFDLIHIAQFTKFALLKYIIQWFVVLIYSQICIFHQKNIFLVQILL